MIRQGHIERSEAILALWFAIGAKVLLTLPASLVADGLTAGWMLVLGGAAASAVGFLPLVLLQRRFGPMPLARVADEAAGLAFGKISALVLTFFFVGLVALVLRQFAEAFVITILPRTPVRVVTIVLALTVAYCAYSGLEAIGRLSVFIAPWLIVVLLLVLFGQFDDISLQRLFPLWGRGPLHVLGSSVLRSSLYAEVLVLGVMFPYLREAKDAKSIGLWAVALSALVLVGVQIVIIGIFDVLGTDQLAFPIIHLARMISFGRFLTRIEALLVFLWIFAAALKLTVLLWAGVTNLAECLRLPDYRPLVTPVTAIAVSGSLWFPNLTQVELIDFEYVRRWAWLPVYGLPLVLWLIAVIRKKPGQPAEGPTQQPGEPGGLA